MACLVRKIILPNQIINLYHAPTLNTAYLFLYYFLKERQRTHPETKAK